MKKNIFILGGCRSGKSNQALKLAEKIASDNKIFIATCIVQDEEMKQRVANHQKGRGQEWKTVEAPLQLPETIADNAKIGDVVVVDCLTLWISNLLMQGKETLKVEKQILNLVHAIEAAACPVVLVSNEVGTGIVPENKLVRMFRDLVGVVNQAVAKSADKVVWMVAGIPVTIKK